MKKTWPFILVLMTFNVMAKIPIMDIYFSGPLKRDCQFVDSVETIEATRSMLTTLNQIDNRDQSCQSLLNNSKAFLNSYIKVLERESKELIVARENLKVVEAEIEKLVLDNTYTGQFDNELLKVKKDIQRLSNQNLSDKTSILQTLNLGSTTFDALEKNPKCAHQLSRNILSPLLTTFGGAAGIMGANTGNYSAALFGAGAKFLSSAISYISRITSDSYQSLRDLTESNNYYTNYKCALKNIESIYCELAEQEEFQRDVNLDELAQEILKLDNENGDFKELRDLKRHRYRISSLVENLQKIYNSPETFNDLREIVILQTRISNLDLVAKLPPLKYKVYIERMDNSEDFPDYKPPIETEQWSIWVQNEIKFEHWYNRYFNSGDFLGKRVKHFCKSLKNNNPTLYGLVYNENKDQCQPQQLQKNTNIHNFINLVIVEALYELQLEIKRINDKIKLNPNVGNLFAEVTSQQVDLGHNDYKEFKLSELLNKYINHANGNVENTASPAHIFAKEVKAVANALLLLIDDVDSKNSFSVRAQKAYDQIAEVSNNGVQGGVLHRSNIQSKISSYFEKVTNSYVLHENEKVAKRFIRFEHLANLHKKYSSNLDQGSNQGSSNLSVVRDIKDAFFNVFGKTINKMLKKDISSYKSNDENIYEREVIHSCAMIMPFLGNEVKDTFKRMRKFCQKVIHAKGGIPYLRGMDSSLHPIKPDNAPGLGERCYYHEYQEEVMRNKMILYRGRSGGIRF